MIDSKKVDAVISEAKGKTAVVVLSGGQDSVTCLGLALQNFEKVYAIGFHYGQKHSVELFCAERICLNHKVPFVVFNIPALQTIGNSALIAGSGQDVSEAHSQNAALPASFVPNRNALFLTTAHAYAQKVGAECIITGVCQTDYSGYPDCRLAFIELLEKTLNVGYLTNIKIITPMMSLTKAETFLMAEKLNFLDEVIDGSHTCYNGEHQLKKAWGYGCGECPACKLRKAGYEEYTAI